MTKEERWEFNSLRNKVNEMERKIDKVLTIVKGIAIGIAIGGIIFGFLTIKDLISFAK